MLKTNAQLVMNALRGIPRMRIATLLIVLVVAFLVLLEKNLSSTVSARGDVYPALLTFVVILSKTIIPLAVLWTVFHLKPSSLGWVRSSLFTAVWKGLALALMMMAFAFVYQHYSPLLFGKPYVSTGARILHEGTSLPAMGIGVAAALLNAFGEEIIFRGMLLSRPSAMISKSRPDLIGDQSGGRILQSLSGQGIRGLPISLEMPCVSCIPPARIRVIANHTRWNQYFILIHSRISTVIDSSQSVTWCVVFFARSFINNPG